MTEIDVAEAEAQLPDLLERAEQGEEIVITRGGEPVIRLQCLHDHGKDRTFCDLRGKIHLPESSNRVKAGARK